MYILIGLIIGITLIIAMMYNSLINKKNQVENAFGGMDAQLKKRYDLIEMMQDKLNKFENSCLNLK